MDIDLSSLTQTAEGVAVLLAALAAAISGFASQLSAIIPKAKQPTALKWLAGNYKQAENKED